MEKYNILDNIGDGTYGTVYKAINTKTNELVAIKTMKRIYNSWEECLDLKEVKSLINMKHSNIVKLLELIFKDKQLFMVFEYVGQNLYDYSIKPQKELSETKIRNIIYQILQGLAHMHSRSFFHRDIKPENILINEDIVKIADFGLAKETSSIPPYTEYVSTRWYRSPEVLLKSGMYNYPIDIFAVGVLMAELYMNKPLFPGKNEYDQMNKICEILGTPQEWTEGYNLATKINYKFPSHKRVPLITIIQRANPKGIDLLEKMLSFNPANRPTASDCLQHPFFQCFDILCFYGLKTNKTTGAEKLLMNPMKVSKHFQNSKSIAFGQSNSNSSFNNTAKKDLLSSNKYVSIYKENKNMNSNKSHKYKFEDFFNIK